MINCDIARSLFRDQIDDFLDTHALVVALFGAVVFENRPRRVLHRWESRSRELVGIDDDVRAELLPLLLVDRIERGRYEYDRRGLILRSELFDEFLDLGRILLAAVDVVSVDDGDVV